MCIDQAWLDARIAATQARIEALEEALLVLTTEGNGITSYTLDTGQSRQVVQRSDLSSLERVLASLYNRLATLCARKTGSNTMTARPAW